MGNIIVAIIVAAILIYAIRTTYKNKKSGKCCSGCSGCNNKKDCTSTKTKGCSNN